jgi:hypothetical protein
LRLVLYSPLKERLRQRIEPGNIQYDEPQPQRVVKHVIKPPIDYFGTQA